MSELRVVTTSSMTVVSWSIWNPTFTEKVPIGYPGIEVLVDLRAAQHVEKCADGQDERADDSRDGEVGGFFLQIFAEQSCDQEAGERQERYECVFEHRHLYEKIQIITFHIPSNIQSPITMNQTFELDAWSSVLIRIWSLLLGIYNLTLHNIELIHIHAPAVAREIRMMIASATAASAAATVMTKIANTWPVSDCR